jgi:hypothetical protein
MGFFIFIFLFLFVGWIEQNYENKNKKVHSLVKKLKINVKMHGEHNVELNWHLFKQIVIHTDQDKYA